MAPVRPPAPVLDALIRAATLPGVGPVRLWTALAGPDAAAAGPGAVSGPVPARGSGLGPDPSAAMARLEALAREAGARATSTDRARARGWAARALSTIRRTGMHVLRPDDAVYPPELRQLSEPPFPLFALGHLSLLETPRVAIVGTRSMTAYGREAAHRIASGLATAGVTVVSGLARGVDGVAHRAAGPGRTIGVVGCGLDVVFPKAHTALQESIGRDGLLLGEQLPGTAPTRFAFPRRNRIIAGVVRAVVVVEAPARSGALSTAAHAREQGRDVFAVPGPIGVPTSEGTNALIRDGATLVTGAREVLEALGLPPPPPGSERDTPPPGLEGQALALWRALDREPRHADEVAARAGLEPRRGLASLLSLEIQGHARQLAGLRFVRG
ncbi:MAG: DNA-processing protein DprA [Gemmatimonadota bacterium]